MNLATQSSLIAAGEVLLFCLVAIAGGFFCFKFLKSTAIVRTKKMQLGGGAALTFVLFAMLWRASVDIQDNIVQAALELPDDKLEQPVQYTWDRGRTEVVTTIKLSPATQLISEQELKGLDRNLFDINEELGIAIGRPTNLKWEVGTFDQVDTLGMLDIPGVASGLGILPTKSWIKPIIFGVRSKEIHHVIIGPDAYIQDLPVVFNALADPEVFNQLQQYYVDFIVDVVGSIDDDPDNEKIKSDVEQELVRQRETQGQVFENSFPKHKKVQNGIYIIVLPRDVLRNYLLNKLLPRRTLLEMALQYFIMSGTFGLGSVTNVYISGDSSVATFDGSVRFEDVEIDGERKEGTMNNLGFVVVDADRAVIANFSYLSIGQPYSVVREMENFFDSMRIARSASAQSN